MILTPATQGLDSLLQDSRLRIPLCHETPTGTRLRSLRANSVVPFGYFSEPGANGLIDVIDEVTFAAAERELFRSLTKPSDGWISRWFHRPVSLRLSRLLVRSPLHPNHVSLFAAAVGVSAGWVLAGGAYSSQVAGAALLELQSLLDGCDGEMSRATYRGSRLGAWLDTVGDDLSNYSFFAGASFALSRSAGPLIYEICGVSTLGLGLVTSGLLYWRLYRMGSGDLLAHPLLGQESDSRFVRAVRPLFKRDTFIVMLFAAAVFDELGPALVASAAAAFVLFARLVHIELGLYRKHRSSRTEAVTV